MDYLLKLSQISAATKLLKKCPEDEEKENVEFTLTQS